MAEETRYLYTINPKKPIKDIPDLGVIRCPRSYLLSKEEVKICLKSASVYRRFANESKNVWVTLANLDRLHNEKFMEEDEYNKLCYEKEFGNKGVVVEANTAEPDKAEEQEDDAPTTEAHQEESIDEGSIEDTEVEETKDETPQEEAAIEEDKEVADADEESTEEPEVEEIEDEVEEIEDGDDEETSEEKPQTQKQGKKKKH